MMRKLLVVVLAVMSFNSFAQENEPKTPEERAEKMTEKMASEFSLDDEKSEKLNAINLKFAQKIYEVRHDQTLSKEDKKSTIKSAMDTRHEELKEVLTDEQIEQVKEKEKEHFEKRQEMVQKKRAHRKNLTAEDKAALRTEKLAEELDLTDEQKEKVEALTLKVIQKVEVIRADSTMTPEKKKEFIQGNMKDFKNSMKSILTEEQFNKFEQMAEERKQKMDAKDPK